MFLSVRVDVPNESHVIYGVRYLEAESLSTSNLCSKPRTDHTNSNAQSPSNKVQRSVSASQKQRRFSDQAGPTIPTSNSYSKRNQANTADSKHQEEEKDGSRRSSSNVKVPASPHTGSDRKKTTAPSTMNSAVPSGVGRGRNSPLVDRAGTVQPGNIQNGKDSSAAQGSRIPSMTVTSARTRHTKSMSTSVHPSKTTGNNSDTQRPSTAPQRLPVTSPSAHNISSSAGTEHSNFPRGIASRRTIDGGQLRQFRDQQNTAYNGPPASPTLSHGNSQSRRGASGSIFSKFTSKFVRRNLSFRFARRMPHEGEIRERSEGSRARPDSHSNHILESPPDVQHLTGCGFEAEPPVTPRFEAEPPVTPRFEAEPPVTPRFEAEPPVTPRFEAEPPVTPRFEAEPPVTPRFEAEPPVTPRFEAEPPVTPRFEAEPPVTPRFEAEPPVTPRFEAEPPVTPRFEAEPPVTRVDGSAPPPCSPPMEQIPH
uniref:serine/threonine-protein kinase MARK2 n=1 Tax=Pristiophorus japonicus TaxID=55135 RepID=UPI00398E8E58